MICVYKTILDVDLNGIYIYNIQTIHHLEQKLKEKLKFLTKLQWLFIISPNPVIGKENFYLN